MIRLLPRTSRGTWLLTGAGWLGLCLVAWRDVPPRPRAVLGSDDWPQTPVRFSPDGRILVTRNFDAPGKNTDFQFWDVATGRPLPHPPKLPPSHGVFAFSSDGRWLLSSDPGSPAAGKEYCFWDMATGQVAAKETAGQFDRPLFSPTRPVIAWAYAAFPAGPRGVRIAEVPSRRLIADLPDAGPPVAFSRDGRTLAACVVGPDIRARCVGVWDAATGWPLATFFRPRDEFIGLGALAFTPDGTGLAVLTTRNVVVYDVPAGRERFRLPRAEVLTGSTADVVLTLKQGPGGLCGFDPDSGGPRYAAADAPFSEPTVGGQWFMQVDHSETAWDRFREWVAAQVAPAGRVPPAYPSLHLVNTATGERGGRPLTGGRVNILAPDGTTVAVRTNAGPTELYHVPWRPAATRVAAAAGLLALPAAGLAWWRCRRLRRSGTAMVIR